MMSTCIDTLSVEGRFDFFNSFDNVLTDCDGVLWIDNNILPGATQVMNGFKNNNKNISFVTNSNTKTRAQLLEKFLLLGFLSSINDVISSGFLAARYLKDNLDPSKQVYVIGSPALSNELNALNVKHFGVGEDYLNTSVSEFVDKVKLESNVGAVLVGFDDYFSYPKLFKAASYLKDQNVLFLATNMDEVFPIASNSNIIMPATGSLVIPVKVSAGRDPFVIGKPSTYICDFLTENNKIDPSRTLMIGDRCSTDIVFGKRCGFKTLLVFTGVNSLKDVEEWNKSDDPTLQELVPDYYAEGIDSLKAIFPVPL
ncbi:HAD-like domain,2-phosphoglycolate phosphatase, eukaryotic,HAD-superfamily hydrolase, subfamily IIA [Cinara cedri]|uniref:HAD-like domain,2-phosphoglycolate phosphatase, eukaryotic,HAD-superfamily hydrolase, subfamily IIA n=1 Tax=Cinara cedri TaxID=506608 RepID=A0A5E4MKY2_9HEMI|nr:HAD-like domain,2-phosphoglycolate phosphatase, eukaryotic,HAD-superfamily hydrolase, subfamily IIA [Cinara cedri]